MCIVAKCFPAFHFVPSKNTLSFPTFYCFKLLQLALNTIPSSSYRRLRRNCANCWSYQWRHSARLQRPTFSLSFLRRSLACSAVHGVEAYHSQIYENGLIDLRFRRDERESTGHNQHIETHMHLWSLRLNVGLRLCRFNGFRPLDYEFYWCFLI